VYILALNKSLEYSPHQDTKDITSISDKKMVHTYNKHDLYMVQKYCMFTIYMEDIMSLSFGFVREQYICTFHNHPGLKTALYNINSEILFHNAHYF